MNMVIGDQKITMMPSKLRLIIQERLHLILKEIYMLLMVRIEFENLLFQVIALQ